MRGGKLDLRATVQRAAQRRDAFGEIVTDSWADVATIWAGEMSMAGLERYASQQDIAQADLAFLVRAWPGPETFGPEERFRLMVGGVAYYVRAVVRVRGHRSGLGWAVTASTRAEITAAEPPAAALAREA